MCEQIPGRLYNTLSTAPHTRRISPRGNVSRVTRKMLVSFRLSTVSVLVHLLRRPTSIYAADDFDIFYWMG